LLGSIHPEVLTAKTNLVTLYKALGRHQEAKKLGVHLTKTRERLLGPTHPETLDAKLDLALTYNKLGRSLDAERLVAHVVESKERFLGPIHPEVLNAKANLVTLYKALGRDREADKLRLQVFYAKRVVGRSQQAEKRGHILGREYLDTLSGDANLAFMEKGLGRRQGTKHLKRKKSFGSQKVTPDDFPQSQGPCNASRGSLSYATEAAQQVGNFLIVIDT
ncbi:hypothetical protein BU17DRAFT_50060, partial [Hysterangium stoloniferum]